MTHNQYLLIHNHDFDHDAAGHLYVAGGQHKSPADAGMDIEAAYLRDLWRLDLDKLDAWEQLPSYPIPFKTSPSLICGMSMSVHADKAYLFMGHPKIDFFDLKTGQWGFIKTEFKRDDGRAGPGPWPYPNNSLSDYAMQMVDGRMYVFGGSHAEASLGTNLFVVLDLATRKWTRLSGTVLPTPDYSCPGPRKWPASWVTDYRIYIMYGCADRQGAKMQNQPYAADDAFGYSDFWSWGIKEQKWRREIISGNPPCPRAETACTYVCTQELFSTGRYLKAYYKEPNTRPNSIIWRVQPYVPDNIPGDRTVLPLLVLCRYIHMDSFNLHVETSAHSRIPYLSGTVTGHLRPEDR